MADPPTEPGDPPPTLAASGFPQFCKMPLEIRRKVYKESMPRVVHQALIYNPKTFPKWNHDEGDWCREGPPIVAVAIPALLHAFRESRDYALEHVQIRRQEKEDVQGRGADSYHHVVCRLFDNEWDCIFVHPCHFDAFVTTFMEQIPWFPWRLIFAEQTRDYNPRYHWEDDDTFPNQAEWDEITEHHRYTWNDFKKLLPKCINLKAIMTTWHQDYFPDFDLVCNNVKPRHGGYRVTARPVPFWWEMFGDGLRDELLETDTPNGVPWKGWDVNGNEKLLLKLGNVRIKRIVGWKRDSHE